MKRNLNNQEEDLSKVRTIIVKPVSANLNRIAELNEGTMNYTLHFLHKKHLNAKY